MSSAVKERAGTPALVLGRSDGHCTDELSEKGLNFRDGNSQLSENGLGPLETLLQVTVAWFSARFWT